MIELEFTWSGFYENEHQFVISNNVTTKCAWLIQKYRHVELIYLMHLGYNWGNRGFDVSKHIAVELEC